MRRRCHTKDRVRAHAGRANILARGGNGSAAMVLTFERARRGYTTPFAGWVNRVSPDVAPESSERRTTYGSSGRRTAVIRSAHEASSSVGGCARAARIRLQAARRGRCCRGQDPRGVCGPGSGTSARGHVDPQEHVRQGQVLPARVEARREHRQGAAQARRCRCDRLHANGDELQDDAHARDGLQRRGPGQDHDRADEVVHARGGLEQERPREVRLPALTGAAATAQDDTAKNGDRASSAIGRRE